MKLTSVLVAAALAIGGICIGGCQSGQSQPSDQNNGFAGGNGAFGENPVNPGEHSQQRFNNPPATQPAGQ